MRHAKRGRKLGRTSSHRLALFRNQVHSLVEHGRIVTTLPKAKELRRVAERVVTRGKTDSVPARRWVARWIPDRTMVKKVFEDLGPRFADRPGGYTRIVKLGPRQGDGAEMAVIEWVDYEKPADAAPPPKTKSKRKGKAKPKPRAKAKGQADGEAPAEAPAKTRKKAAKKPAKKPAKKAKAG